MDGKGVYNWPNGSHYEGNIKKGLRHGTGIFNFGGSFTKLHYEGEWFQGKRHGQGNLYFNWPIQQNINCYKGSWKQNRKDGFGSMYYPSGNIYKGEWKNDKKEGSGRMIWRNNNESEINEIYDGYWKNGYAEGNGSYYWLYKTDKDENITKFAKRNYYQGDWKNGKRNGKGKFFYADGSQYIGEWKDNLKHGNGKFLFADGRIFEGSFINDQMVGYDREAHPPTLVMVLPIFELLDSSQISSLDRLLRQHLAKLKDIFKYYSSLGYGFESDSFNITIIQLSQLLKDSNILTNKFSLSNYHIHI